MIVIHPMMEKKVIKKMILKMILMAIRKMILL